MVLGTIEIMFISVNFYFGSIPAIKSNRFFDIPEGDKDKIYLANMILSSLFGAVFCFLLVSLLT